MPNKMKLKPKILCYAPCTLMHISKCIMVINAIIHSDHNGVFFLITRFRSQNKTIQI